MSKVTANSVATLTEDAALPQVRLEVRQGKSRPTTYTVSDVSFLIGSVPGCDVRLPGANLPPLLCMVLRRPAGAALRKLSLAHPILVNGEPATQAVLRDGDHLSMAGTEVVVHVQAAAATEKNPSNSATASDAERAAAKEIENARQHLQKQIQAFRQQVMQFEAERKAHPQDHARPAAMPAAVAERDKAVSERDRKLSEQAGQLQKQTAEMQRQQQEIAKTRQELVEIRRQLYEHYQERRDRLAGLQEAVNNAAKKVQERKRQLDADLLQFNLRKQAETARQAELDSHASELDRRQIQLDDQQQLLEQRQRTLQQELAERLAECQRQEQALKESQAQHQADLVRLDRMQAGIEERDRDSRQRASEVEAREAEFETRAQNLEAQHMQLEEWHSRLSAMAEQVDRQKLEMDTRDRELLQRATALEGQQAMFANLRSRLEQMRDELRAGEQRLVEDRARQAALEEELNRRQVETQKIQQERQALDFERRQLAERSSVMETAVSQLRHAQEKLAESEMELQRQQHELNERLAAFASREAEVNELARHMEADRQAVAERLQLLTQAEQARESLQEQLRRRSEELSLRQKALDEQSRQAQAEIDLARQQRADLERDQKEVTERVATHMKDVETRAALVLQQTESLREREATVGRQLAEIREQTESLAAQREAIRVEQEELRQLQQDSKAEFDAARKEALELQQRLPDLELRAGTAFERLSYAREQLREYIGEVHSYANQCQEHLESVRGDIQAEGERLQTREQALRHQQDEQRLALAGFRQQIIDWQGQIADFRRLLSENETRLERRHAEVAQRAKDVDQENSRLARQAEELEVQQRHVASQRDEMTTHLNDMRDWYRKKLRELAGLDESDGATTDAAMSRPGTPLPKAGATSDAVAVPGRDILSLTGDVDPADRRLGEVLGTLGLIDGETLNALFMEARRQRRSLRQVLLADGTVTAYQMGLIEAGDLDALMLGNVRVVDRLRVTPHETVYQVFDPRRGRNALLRHLNESEMTDAVHPDEFRQRFRQALINHPNIMATWEVDDIAGRPAALQEWLTGLPSSDWSDLAAVPGVWFRLLSQAGLALHTAHEAGLVHGHLRATDFAFTVDGILKLCHLGEPPWLASQSATKTYEDVAGELHALGVIAAQWANGGRSRKTKALPEPLSGVLQRLRAGSAQAFASAAELLHELDAVSAQVPANPEAWSRFVQHVREHAAPGGLLRQSA